MNNPTLESGQEQLYNAELCGLSRPLDQADMPWLLNVSDGSMDPQHLDALNDRMLTGSPYLRYGCSSDSQEEISDAREEFYLMLGFRNPAHPAYKTFKAMRAQYDHLPPPSTFVASRRIFYEEGLDNLNILSSSFGSLGYKISPRNVKETIDVIKECSPDYAAIINRYPQLMNCSIDKIKQRITLLNSLEGVDSERVIRLFPAILTYKEERIEKRLYAAKTVCELLGWQSGPSELINSLPALPGYSDKKLKVNARIFARHGEPDLSPSRVASLIIMPIETQISAIEHYGSDWIKYVAKMGRQMKGSAREEKALEIKENIQKFEELLGKKAVRDYMRYKFGQQ